MAAKAKLDRWDYAAIPLTLAAGAASVYFSSRTKRPDPPGGIYGWWLIWQIFAGVAAAAIPAVIALRAKLREERAVKHDLDGRTQARVEMTRTLDPIIDAIGRQMGLKELDRDVLSAVVVALPNLLAPRGDARSCFFELEDGEQRKLIPTDYRAGRLGTDQTTFTEDIGDDAIEKVLKE
jgi:hypothetical protein